jgi:hypothetical protein
MIFGVEKTFDPFAKRYGIEWVYLSLDSPLARTLFHNPRWVPVFLDSASIIFVNDGPKFDELRRSVDVRADLARDHIPNWQPTPLPTLLQKRHPHREVALARFLRNVDERRASKIALRHASRFKR